MLGYTSFSIFPIGSSTKSDSYEGFLNKGLGFRVLGLVPLNAAFRA